MALQVHNVERSKEITVDLDLGAEGASIGDQQFFGALFTEGNQPLGFEPGVCQLLALADPTTGRGQVWQCVVTHKWNDGDLTVQFLQDFTETPTVADPFRFAITGGTRDYKGARGEVTYINDQNITFSFESV
jgi:hypothetical protein